MSGGSYAIRGFYLQALISVFEMVKDNRWTSLEMEPEQDKIDITVRFEDKSIKVIQVKSTINIFQKGSIKNIMESIINAQPEASHYEVVLIGEINAEHDHFGNSSNFKDTLSLLEGIDITTKTINIKNIPLNVDAIEENVKKHLEEYLSYLGYEINAEALKLLNKSLVAESLLSSIKKGKLYKEIFEDNLVNVSELFYEGQDKTDEFSVIDNISIEGMKRFKKIKLIRRVALILSIFFALNPFVKFFIEGLTLLDIIGTGGLVCFIVGVILFFKSSDSKFRKMQEEDFEEYNKNIDSAKNHICKITVSNKVEYKGNKKEGNSEIVIYNLSDKIINYIEGKIHFYYGSKKLYSHPIQVSDINPSESVVLFNGRLTPQKTMKYWSSFRVEFYKLTMPDENFENTTIHSGITHRTYRTLLNNYYLPLIDELFRYESTEAVNIMREQYFKIRYLLKHINIKRFFILLPYVILTLCVIMCSLIGVNNFLFIPIKLVRMLF